MVNLTLSIHDLPEDDVILVNQWSFHVDRKLDDSFYIRHFPDMDSDIAKGWMDRLFKTNNDFRYRKEHQWDTLVARNRTGR